MKYTQTTKDEAVKLAKEGIALKVIQTQIGPNPKATMRYLAKVGIDYKVLRKELQEKGKLQGVTKTQEKTIDKKSIGKTASKKK